MFLKKHFGADSNPHPKKVKVVPREACWFESASKLQKHCKKVTNCLKSYHFVCPVFEKHFLFLLNKYDFVCPIFDQTFDKTEILSIKTYYFVYPIFDIKSDITPDVIKQR